MGQRPLSSATCGVYHTLHGRHIVQPLAQPIPVAKAEPYLRRWLLGLESAGLAVDWACRDWTRHFRLPHVRSNGTDYRSPLVSLDRMRPIALQPLVPMTCLEPYLRAGSSLPQRSCRRSDGTTICPRTGKQRRHRPLQGDPVHRDRTLARDVSRARRRSAFTSVSPRAPSGPHRLDRRVGGIGEALEPRRICARRHRHGATCRASRSQDRAHAAPVRGRRWPMCSQQVTASRVEASSPRQQSKSAPSRRRPWPSRMAALIGAIRSAPDGLTGHLGGVRPWKDECWARSRLAAERAARPYASLSAQGGCEPLLAVEDGHLGRQERARDAGRARSPRGPRVAL